MRSWLIAGLVLFAGAAATSAYFFLRAPRVRGDQIIFEVRYSSGASGRRNKGYFVTRAGQVRRFDFYANRNHSDVPQLPNKPTHADLMESFGSVVETVALIPEATIHELLALVPVASGGILACSSAGATDRGTSTYEAWRLDGDDVYSSVLLSMVGNQTCTNTTPEAANLVTKLSKYVTSPTSTDRVSMSSGVAAQTRVHDCRACSGNELCVQSTDGDKYCILRSFDCVNNNSCACNAVSLCAGGRSHCRDLGPGLLTCVP